MIFFKMPEPAEPPLPFCVCAALRQVTRAVTHIYDEALRPSGLRAMQFSILMTIRGHGEATVTELTAYLKLDQTTVTRSLQILERKGWIQQVKQADRRKRTVRVTSKGSATLKKAEPLWSSAQSLALGALDADAWAASQPALSRLVALAAQPRQTD